MSEDLSIVHTFLNEQYNRAILQTNVFEVDDACLCHDPISASYLGTELLKSKITSESKKSDEAKSLTRWFCCVSREEKEWDVVFSYNIDPSNNKRIVLSSFCVSKTVTETDIPSMVMLFCAQRANAEGATLVELPKGQDMTPYLSFISISSENVESESQSVISGIWGGKSYAKHVMEVDKAKLRSYYDNARLYLRLKKEKALLFFKSSMAVKTPIRGDINVSGANSNKIALNNKLPTPHSKATIHIGITLKYKGRLDDPSKERAPRFLIFFSRSMAEYHKVIEMNPEKSVSERYFELEATLNKRYISKVTNLNFHCFTSIYTKDAEAWCGNQAGLCKINLFELINTVFVKKRIFSKKYALDIPASHSIGMVNKGELTVEVLPRIKDSVTGISLSNLDPRIIPRPHENYTATEMRSAVTRYEEDCFETAKAYQPTWPVMKDVHAFFYDSPAGRLPAATFDIPYPIKSKEEYYLNLFSIVLNRRGMTLDQFQSLDDPQTLGSFCLDMATIFSNAIKYITDGVLTGVRSSDGAPFAGGPPKKQPSPFKSMSGGDDYADDYTGKKGKRRGPASRSEEEDDERFELIESFDISRVRGLMEDAFKIVSDPMYASDCEDDARDILIHLHEISTRRWKSPLLNKLKENCKYWVDGACLGGVSSAQISGSTTASEDDMGAHEYLIRIPRYTFFDLVGKYNPKHPLFSMFSEESINMGRKEAIKPLIGEGTGYLFPDSVEVVNKEVRDELTSKMGESVISSLSKTFTFVRSNHSKNNFYKTVTSFFTHLFAYECGVPYMEFTFLYPPGEGENKSRSIYSYSVLFAEFVTLSPNIVLAPQSPIPPNVVDISRMLLDDQCITTPIEPPTKEARDIFYSMAKKYECSVQDRRAQGINLETPNPSTTFDGVSNVGRNVDHPVFDATKRKVSADIFGDERPQADYRKKPYHEITYYVKRDPEAERTLKKVADSAKRNNILYKILPEPVTSDGLGVFRIVFYLPNKSASPSILKSRRP